VSPAARGVPPGSASPRTAAASARPYKSKASRWPAARCSTATAGPAGAPAMGICWRRCFRWGMS